MLKSLEKFTQSTKFPVFSVFLVLIGIFLNVVSISLTLTRLLLK